MQGLWDEGARRIGVVGLTPMGCLPIVISLYSDSPIQNRTCVEDLSTVAREFNIRLQNELNSMQSGLAHSGSRIAYLDTYTLIADMTMGHKFGEFIIPFIYSISSCTQKSVAFDF